MAGKSGHNGCNAPPYQVIPQVTLAIAYGWAEFVVFSPSTASVLIEAACSFLLVAASTRFFCTCRHARTLSWSALALVVAGVHIKHIVFVVEYTPGYVSAALFLRLLGVFCVLVSMVSLSRFQVLALALLCFGTAVLLPLVSAAHFFGHNSWACTHPGTLGGIGAWWVNFVADTCAASVVVAVSFLQARRMGIETQSHIDAHHELVQQASRAQALLETAMPPAVARALMAGVPASELSKSYPSACVAFLCLADYEAKLRTLRPDEVLHFLDQVYGAIDRLVDVYAEVVMKIESIGGVYLVMAADDDDADEQAGSCAILLAQFCMDALHLLNAIVSEDAGYSSDHGPASPPSQASVALQVGIAAGPVTAGVIGRSRRYYRIFGDCVNVASRMMSTGEVGRVQVTEGVARSIQGEDVSVHGLHADRRGVVAVKGKGDLVTYWVRRDPFARRTPGSALYESLVFASRTESSQSRPSLCSVHAAAAADRPSLARKPTTGGSAFYGAQRDARLQALASRKNLYQDQSGADALRALWLSPMGGIDESAEQETSGAVSWPRPRSRNSSASNIFGSIRFGRRRSSIGAASRGSLDFSPISGGSALPGDAPTGQPDYLPGCCSPASTGVDGMVMFSPDLIREAAHRAEQHSVLAMTEAGDCATDDPRAASQSRAPSVERTVVGVPETPSHFSPVTIDDVKSGSKRQGPMVVLRRILSVNKDSGDQNVESGPSSKSAIIGSSARYDLSTGLKNTQLQSASPTSRCDSLSPSKPGGSQQIIPTASHLQVARAAAAAAERYVERVMQSPDILPTRESPHRQRTAAGSQPECFSGFYALGLQSDKNAGERGDLAKLAKQSMINLNSRRSDCGDCPKRAAVIKPGDEDTDNGASFAAHAQPVLTSDETIGAHDPSSTEPASHYVSPNRTSDLSREGTVGAASQDSRLSSSPSAIAFSPKTRKRRSITVQTEETGSSTGSSSSGLHTYDRGRAVNRLYYGGATALGVSLTMHNSTTSSERPFNGSEDVTGNDARQLSRAASLLGGLAASDSSDSLADVLESSVERSSNPSTREGFGQNLSPLSAESRRSSSHSVLHASPRNSRNGRRMHQLAPMTLAERVKQTASEKHAGGLLLSDRGISPQRGVSPSADADAESRQPASTEPAPHGHHSRTVSGPAAATSPLRVISTNRVAPAPLLPSDDGASESDEPPTFAPAGALSTSTSRFGSSRASSVASHAAGSPEEAWQEGLARDRPVHVVFESSGKSKASAGALQQMEVPMCAAEPPNRCCAKLCTIVSSALAGVRPFADPGLELRAANALWLTAVQGCSDALFCTAFLLAVHAVLVAALVTRARDDHGFLAHSSLMGLSYGRMIAAMLCSAYAIFLHRQGRVGAMEPGLSSAGHARLGGKEAAAVATPVIMSRVQLLLLVGALSLAGVLLLLEAVAEEATSVRTQTEEHTGIYASHNNERHMGTLQMFLPLLAFASFGSSACPTVRSALAFHGVTAVTVASAMLPASYAAGELAGGVLGCVAVAVAAVACIARSWDYEAARRVAIASEVAVRVAELDANTILHTLMPEPIVRQIIRGEEVAPAVHAGIAILVADLVGFTALASALPPHQLMATLNLIYSRFDRLVEHRPRLFKVDTVGDAFIVVGGIFDDDGESDGEEGCGGGGGSDRSASKGSGRSVGTLHGASARSVLIGTGTRARALARTRTSLEQLIDLGLAMQRANAELRRELGGIQLHMRVGVHVGSVTTGIVGSHRPRFGVFGSDLSAAEALQAAAGRGEVMVSPAAAQAYLASTFHFAPRPLVGIPVRDPVGALLAGQRPPPSGSGEEPGGGATGMGREREGPEGSSRGRGVPADGDADGCACVSLRGGREGARGDWSLGYAGAAAAAGPLGSDSLCDCNCDSQQEGLTVPHAAGRGSATTRVHGNDEGPAGGRDSEGVAYVSGLVVRPKEHL